DLADRAGRDVLARVELALREGPVVVAGAVHEQHLALPGLGRPAGDDGARGDDVRQGRAGRAGHAASVSGRPGPGSGARPGTGISRRHAGAAPPGPALSGRRPGRAAPAPAPTRTPPLAAAPGGGRATARAPTPGSRAGHPGRPG